MIVTFTQKRHRWHSRDLSIFRPYSKCYARVDVPKHSNNFPPINLDRSWLDLSDLIELIYTVTGNKNMSPGAMVDILFPSASCTTWGLRPAVALAPDDGCLLTTHWASIFYWKGNLLSVLWPLRRATNYFMGHIARLVACHYRKPFSTPWRWFKSSGSLIIILWMEKVCKLHSQNGVRRPVWGERVISSRQPCDSRIVRLTGLATRLS